MPNQKKIKVLIVDDSALIRSLLKSIIEQDSRLEVCGTAADPYEAREKIKQLRPDVLTLDIEMPKMSGIAFLKNLMRLRPMPVVMISTLTQAGAPETLTALELGAVDFLPKPKDQDPSALGQYAGDICRKLRVAAHANIVATKKEQPIVSTLAAPSSEYLKPNYICAIGASTGGTEAIREVVQVLPENSPPVVCTQHIPDTFSQSFAKRVDAASKVKVWHAEDGQEILAGNVYIAPGHSHLRVKKVGHQYFCALSQEPAINRHRPSVEPLFDSVIEACGANAIGVLLTGMGADGAEALLRMRQAGAMTLIQNKATCVVWGMPRVAHELGAAQQVLDLNKIAPAIMRDSVVETRRRAQL